MRKENISANCLIKNTPLPEAFPIFSGAVGVIGIRRAIEYYLGITHQNGRARVVEDGFESYVEGVEHGAPVISAMEFLQMGVQ